jgi:hypothetical protein
MSPAEWFILVLYGFPLVVCLLVVIILLGQTLIRLRWRKRPKKI